ncbi:MAG: hypothetical protein VX278_17235 [Myxococcota bacterium]|nr:hypothetical protein [Myxococcota bacterium]
MFISQTPMLVAWFPSRKKSVCCCKKSPCPHLISLIWQSVRTPEAFQQELFVPDFILKDLADVSVGYSNGCSLDVAVSREIKEPEPTAKRRRRRRRIDKMEEGALIFQRWTKDLIEQGFKDFIEEPIKPSEALSRRLVDCQLSGVAEAIDMLPNRLLKFSVADRLHVAIDEISFLSLMVAFFLKRDALPKETRLDTLRRVGLSMAKKELLADPQRRRLKGIWRFLGTTGTQHKGLWRYETWLCRASDEAYLVQVVDYFHSAFRQRPQYRGIVEAEIVLYPGDGFQGIIDSVRYLDDDLCCWPNLNAEANDDLRIALRYQYQEPLKRNPFQRKRLVFVKNVSISFHKKGSVFDSTLVLPLKNKKDCRDLDGLPIERLAFVWDGYEACVLAAHTPFGKWFLSEQHR